MTFSIERHPEAQEELSDAVEYYEDLNLGLGDTFLHLVDIVEDSIIAMPEAWPKVPGWRRKPALRSHRTGKYPYRIVYYIEKKLFPSTVSVRLLIP